MKISIASASMAAAAISLVLSGAAPAAAKGKVVHRDKAAAKVNCAPHSCKSQCGRKARSDKADDSAPGIGK